MDTTSDNRFDSRLDFDFASSLLLDLARERSLEGLMEKSVVAAMTHHEIARTEVWLIEKGDLCSRCAHRPECPDQTRCLHLVAGGENPPGSGGEREASRFFKTRERIPLGVGFLGRIATTGQLAELQNADEASSDFSRLEFSQAEEIRTYAGAAISFRGEILGVLAIFSRANRTKDRIAWHQIYSDHFGAAIANARAFEEIQRLKAQLEMQNAYLQEEVVEAKAFGKLVGQSAALRHIVSQIDLVAPTEASVLILGESGTGKELVAHEIHQRSRRKDKPLVRVNCASIPKELFESEFFGHARGAFTGAIKDRAGRFEAAEGGTLFLDEIGEVPLDLQSKLLRVLQEKRYERVGEDRTRLADVRVIAATNCDLKQAVAAGRFREDLYYRLNVFPIQVPPLRERMEDVSLLAKHFVGLSVKELGCPKRRLTRAAITKLQNYHWPGNIRELRNVIERAIIISRGGALDFDLPASESALVPRPPARQESETESEFLTEAELQRRERENLLVILEKAHWKIMGRDGAAELLGVKPTTLMTRMKKMGLQRPV
ncbi:MAG TPA: sigma 54-interacting transcriptional regulator [Candidatus Limnocylindrales bacterium]|nr:sigma 54-interacting transcriptional regulator [Candidatus Limnocylindrales bacterium]